jgi:hypothetical protein
VVAEAQAPSLPGLLDRRLAIVTGKGGTGKTTVCAALARAAADRGLRVLVAEVGRDAQIPRLLAADAPPVGYAEQGIAPRITAIRIDPYAALAEYLGLQIGVPALVTRVVGNRGFRQLMEASPGWRELITLGKVWHLEQMRLEGRPKYDLIVVDAPATGHGVTFLDVPRVVASAVRAGPLRQHTEQVESLIADPKRSLLLPVALAEELPTRETIALVERVREALSIRVDRVIVNSVYERPFPQGLDDLDERLAALPAQGFEQLPETHVLGHCAHHLRARYELNERYVGEIEAGTGLPVIRLPYLKRGVRDANDIALLASRLLASPEGLA